MYKKPLLNKYICAMLQCNNVSIKIQNRIIIKECNIHLPKPELVALIGKNGEGKSTFLKSIAGLFSYQGNMQLLQTNVNYKTGAQAISNLVSFLPSTPPLNTYLSVEDVLQTATLSNTHLNTLPALQKLKIPHLSNSLFLNLSDGEKQKVMIARALLQNRPIILLDEPLAFLDYPSKIEVLQILKNLVTNENKLILFSSHDLELSLSHSEKIICIKNTLCSLINKENIDLQRPESIFN